MEKRIVSGGLQMWGRKKRCAPKLPVGYHYGARTYFGNSRGARCVFPFEYKGKTYTYCPNVDWYEPWCATVPNYGKNGKKWGLCRSTIRTHGGNANYVDCVFPFIYRGKTYNTCTKKNANKYWCATVKNYNKDGKMGILWKIRGLI